MADEQEYDTFESQLDEGDWGLIIGPEGELKGLFMPEGSDEDLVPDSIVEICEKYFGVDLSEDATPTTLH